MQPWIFARHDTGALKVAWSQKVFHFCWHLQKWVPNFSPEHYAAKEKMVRWQIWHPFLEMSVKVKFFLRLSHLYKTCSYTKFLYNFLFYAGICASGFAIRAGGGVVFGPHCSDRFAQKSLWKKQNTFLMKFQPIIYKQIFGWIEREGMAAYIRKPNEIYYDFWKFYWKCKHQAEYFLYCDPWVLWRRGKLICYYLAPSYVHKVTNKLLTIFYQPRHITCFIRLGEHPFKTSAFFSGRV